MLTSAKLTEGYLVVGITRELDKEPLLHCFSIYINYIWSMLQQYLPALMSMHCPHVLLLIHHKATMLYTCALMSYSLISVVYVCQAQFTLWWKSAECTQRWADLWNDLGFSLYAAPSVCHMVTTSDEGEKSEWEWVLNGVSPLNTRDWVQ